MERTTQLLSNRSQILRFNREDNDLGCLSSSSIIAGYFDIITLLQFLTPILAWLPHRYLTGLHQTLRQQPLNHGFAHHATANKRYRIQQLTSLSLRRRLSQIYVT